MNEKWKNFNDIKIFDINQITEGHSNFVYNLFYEKKIMNNIKK